MDADASDRPDHASDRPDHASGRLATALWGFVSDAVLLVDPRTRAILDATESAVALLGATSTRELLGRTPESFHDPGDLDRHELRPAGLARTGREALPGVPFARLDGTTFTADLEARAFDDDAGRPCVLLRIAPVDPPDRLHAFVGASGNALGVFAPDGRRVGPGGAGAPDADSLLSLVATTELETVRAALRQVTADLRPWIGAVALTGVAGIPSANHLLTLVPFVDPGGEVTVVALAHSTEEFLHDGRLAREVTAGMSDGLLVADMQTMRLVGANEAMATMLGLELDELLRRRVPDNHPVGGNWEPAFRAIVLGETDRASAIDFLRGDGEILVADVEARALSFDGAHLVAAFVRPTAERLADAQLESLLGQSDVFFGVARPDGELLVANRPPSPEVVATGRPARLQEHVVEAAQERLAEVLERVRAGETVHETLDCQMAHGIGQWAAILSPVIVGDEVVQVLVLATDVSERLFFERRLREIVEGAPLVTYWVAIDEAGEERLEYVSPQMEHWLGHPLELWLRPRDEVVTWLASLVHADDAGVFAERVRAAAAREPWSGELRLRTAYGGYRWGLESFTFLTAADGSVVRIGFVLDVDGRRRSQEEHDALAERFRTLIEASSALIQSVGPDGRLLLVNDAWGRRMGYTPQEAVGLELMELIHPDDRGHCRSLLARCLAGESLRGVEARLIARDGSVVEVRGTVAPVLQDGVVLSTNAFFDDVGARTAVERAERIFGTLAATSPDIFWLQDIESGQVTFVGEQVSRLTGVAARTIMEQADAWYSFVHPDDRPHARETFRTWRLDGAREPLVAEYRYMRADGSLAWMRDSARGIVDADGVRRVIAGVASDVTTERLESATASGWSHDAIVVIDADDRIVRWNTGATELFGRTSAEVVGREATSVLAETDGQALVAHVAAARRGELPSLLQATTSGGATTPRQVEIAVERWGANGASFVTLHAHDISERVARERELQEARDEIAHLLEVRQELVNMLVHDLRSPITAIRFGADMLAADEDLPLAALEVAEHLVASTDRLERLVDQVLVTARLESGSLALELLDTDLRSVAEEVVAGVAPGQRGRIELAEGVWPTAHVDRGLVVRVVENLVGNALKFSPAGQPVTIACARAPAGGQVRLSVADRGSGVPDAFKERIFDRFGVARHHDRAVRQTGLGLTFCRLAVEAHGGAIAVEDNTPSGAVFVLLLPGA